MDHRGLIASLSIEQRKTLVARSNLPGLMGLAWHGGALLVASCLILLRPPFWFALLPVQGILLIFLFTLLHETVHRTAFRSRWINDLVARICSFLILLPADWFRYFHFAHHRHTQDPAKDPELAHPPPETPWQY